MQPRHLKAKDVETAILLLQSKENTTLLAAVEALSKYASKSEDNIKVLFDLGIVNSVLPITKHENLFIKRFAAKLLAEMTVQPDVATYLIKSDHLLYFVKQLTSEKDTFMQEYFSAILAKLTRDSYGTALLAKYCSDMNFLFERMQSPDPDIKRNSIEILYNLMQDSVCSQKISESEKLDFSSLYEYFGSPYPEIQSLALNTVAEIIGRNKSEDMQSLFRKTNGIKILLNFLENDEWNELHIEALKILNLAAENPAIANDLIDIGGVPQILNYMEHAINPKLFAEAFKIIVHVANISNGRKVLHSHEIVEYLMDALQRSTQSDVIEVSCYGIGKMTLYDPVAKEFANKKLVEVILGFLKKEDLGWSARHAASFALKQLLMSDSRNCDIFLKTHGQDYLLQIMKQSDRIPLENCITVLETLIVIARHPTHRNTLVNLDTIDIICLLLESTSPLADELKIVCCNLLSVLSLEKDGRLYFLKAKGPQRLYILITDAHSIPVRNAAVQLIQTISTDLVAANAFVENKYLSYMLNNRSSARVIPSWDTCIETLFKSHLSAKFAFTGHLSLHDLTQNGFYILRRNVCPFPVLDDIFRFKFCPVEPIYVINFAETTTWNSSQNEAAIEEARNSIKRNIATKGIFLSAENINAWLELKFGRLQYDPYLIEYVRLFKSMLLAAEPEDVATATDVGSTNIQFVLSRAKMLARFVAHQMSGLNPSNRYIEHQLEIHLKEIRERLETSVIPLGQLRVGSYLERALLFKVIADRICLPAALVRGEYGISWIEIAVPQIEDSNRERSFDTRSDKNHEHHPEIIKTSHKSLNKSDIKSCSNEYNREKISFPRNHRSMIYPVKLMKPNFIVDLMDIPGDLIPIGSPRSRLYCTTKLTCDKICCH